MATYWTTPTSLTFTWTSSPAHVATGSVFLHHTKEETGSQPDPQPVVVTRREVNEFEGRWVKVEPKDIRHFVGARVRNWREEKTESTKFPKRLPYVVEATAVKVDVDGDVYADEDYDALIGVIPWGNGYTGYGDAPSPTEIGKWWVDVEDFERIVAEKGLLVEGS